MYSENISTLFQRCHLAYMTSRRGTTSNKHWNNVVYFSIGMYNVEQIRTHFVYFNADMNNIRLPRNNVVFFNLEFHNVGQRRNNVVKMTIPKKNKKKSFQNEYTEFKVSIIFLLPMLREMCWRNLAKQQKFLKDHEKYCTART